MRTLQLFIMTSFLSQLVTYAEWKNLSLPDTRQVNSFTLRNNEYFVASDSGVYFSKNQGENWVAIDSNFPRHSISYAQIFKDSIYALSTGSLSSMRSSKNNNCWEPWKINLPNIPAHNYPFIFNDNMLSIIAGCNLYISIDNGKNWKKIFGSYQYGLCHIVKVCINKQHILLAADNQLYITSDQGETWQSIAFSDTITTIASSIVFSACISGSDLYVSDSPMSNWHHTFSDSTITDIDIVNSSLYACNNKGIIVSTDRGNNWDLVYADTSLTSLSSSETSLIAYNYSTIYVFDANNVSSPTAVLRSQLREASHIEEARGTMYCKPTPYENSFLRLKNISGKYIWENLPKDTDSGCGRYYIGSLLFSDNLIYKVLPPTYGIPMTCASSDAGNTFIESNFSHYLEPHSVFSIKDRIFLGTNIGIYYSLDSGITFQAATSDIPSLPFIDYRSTNTYNDNPCNYYIYKFFHINDIIFAVSDSSLLVSRDDGIHWQSTGTGFPIATRYLPLTTTGSKIFVGTETNGVFYSLDTGYTWLSSNHEAFPTNIYSLHVDSSNLFAFERDSNKVWYRPLSEFTAENHVENPESSAAQPSPLVSIFNNFITTSFNLPSPAKVDISLFSLSGKKIKTFHSSNLNVGNHSFSYTTDFLPGGNYILHTTTGTAQHSKLFFVCN